MEIYLRQSPPGRTLPPSSTPRGRHGDARLPLAHRSRRARGPRGAPRARRSGRRHRGCARSREPSRTTSRPRRGCRSAATAPRAAAAPRGSGVAEVALQQRLEVCARIVASVVGLHRGGDQQACLNQVGETEPLKLLLDLDDRDHVSRGRPLAGRIRQRAPERDRGLGLERRPAQPLVIRCGIEPRALPGTRRRPRIASRAAVGMSRSEPRCADIVLKRQRQLAVDRRWVCLELGAAGPPRRRPHVRPLPPGARDLPRP